jgi:hypothetical protein
MREAQQLGRLYRCGDKTQLPLRMTLRLLAAGQPQVAALYRGWMSSMDAWGNVSERSVKGLLDIVRTGGSQLASEVGSCCAEGKRPGVVLCPKACRPLHAAAAPPAAEPACVAHVPSDVTLSNRHRTLLVLLQVRVSLRPSLPAFPCSPRPATALPMACVADVPSDVSLSDIMAPCCICCCSSV